MNEGPSCMWLAIKTSERPVADDIIWHLTKVTEESKDKLKGPILIDVMATETKQDNNC